MAGMEYEYDRVLDVRGSSAKELYNKLINPDGSKFQDLKDIYAHANVNDYEVVFIPVYVNEKMLMFVCIRNEVDFLEYMNLKTVEEIYDEYPILCEIFRWGITYIISNDQTGRSNDLIYTDIKQSEGYIQIVNDIVNSVTKIKWLPYASILHLIAGWKYEKKKIMDILISLNQWRCVGIWQLNLVSQ